MTGTLYMELKSYCTILYFSYENSLNKLRDNQISISNENIKWSVKHLGEINLFDYSSQSHNINIHLIKTVLTI